ncbi:MAG: hypothetical protein MJA31_15155, partial [Clostridia bacterium]|nr:hypothetical protein [Clostridia bacterium]
LAYPSCLLNYKSNNIINIIKKKDSIEIDDTNNWIIGGDFDGYFGGAYAYILESNFDPQATYYVLYEALQEDYNCQVQETKISYEDNIRGTVNELVEMVANNETDISSLKSYLFQLEERIKVLE